MRNFLNILAVAGVVLLASSVDLITALVVSNPVSALFAHVIFFFMFALFSAVFVYTVKRFLNAIERNDR